MRLLEVEFKGRRKGVFTNPQEFPLQKDDMVIVQADRGEDIGRISLIGDEWQETLESFREEETEVEPVLRLAGKEDLDIDRQNRLKEKEARPYFLEQVRELGLEMKLVDIEYQYDGRKLTFYFTADGRVDFRELVKTLAHHFRTRIDLRQIGARDEAKRLGGIGLCGRELCCATWIREFKPVTTSMLKEQNLLLNPQKNTGLCGKLRCCLRYEVDQYREINRLFPKVDMKVKGPRGSGVVEKISMCHSSLGVHWEDGTRIGYSFDQVNSLTNWDPEKREEIKLVEFSSDPSVVVEEKEEREGRLVTSFDPEEAEQRSGKGRGDRRRSKNKGRKPDRKPRAAANESTKVELVEMKEMRSDDNKTARDDSSAKRRSSRGRGRARSTNRRSSNTPQDKQANNVQKTGEAKPQGAPNQQKAASSEDNPAKKSRGRGRSRSRGRRGSGKPQENRQDKPSQKTSGQNNAPKEKQKDGANSQTSSSARPPRGLRRRKR